MGTFDRIAPLPVQIDELAYERQSQAVSSDFERVSTTIVMRGGGHEGRGEDICYAAAGSRPLARARHRSASRARTRSPRVAEQLDGRDLFTGDPSMPASRDYRRWAFESAALDLALRQAGATLGEVVGREPAPLRFVVSTRLDMRDWLAVAPGLEFKVDPIPGEWDEAHMDALAATGRVRVCDLKAHYHGTPVDTVPDAAFHALIAEHFPDAVLEDVSLDADVLAGARGPPRPRLLRRADPLARRRRRAADARSGTSTSSRRASGRCRACSSASTPAWSAASSCTAAASSSSASGAARFRRSRASSTRTRRTTSLRRPTTRPSRSPGCRRARSSRRRGAPASAGDRGRAGGRGARRRAAEAGDRAEAHPVRAAAPRRDGRVLEAPLRHGRSGA